MQTLLKLLKPYKKKLILVALTDAAGMLLSLFMPFIMSMIVDGGIAAGNMRVILYSALAMLILTALSLTSNLIANRLNSAVTCNYTRDLCKATYEKITALSYTQYAKIGPSGLLTRATDDIFNIEGAISSIVYTVVTVPVMLIGSAALALIADVTLSLIFMLSIPPVMLIVYVFMKPLYNMWDKSDAYVDEQNKIVRERLSGLRVVRAFNNDKKEHTRAKFATEEMAKYMIRANVRSGYIEPVAMFLLNLATVVMVGAAGYRAEVGLLGEAGDIIAIIQYVALISGALLNLSWTIAWLPRLKVSIRRINEVHSLTDETSGEATLPTNADIVLKDVSFTYPDGREPVLKNINLEIKTGENIAFIGGTGSGKTTLARLLVALFDVKEGDISIGGENYRKLKKSDVRDKFSIALSRGMIFEGTLAENVKMGKPEASEEEIYSALKDVCMEDFVKSSDKGLEHFLVGLGNNVSGGQKQRINMARTVIRDTDVYIFDDCFSALDFITESKVKANLAKRLCGKTQITITQRVSTAMKSDKIYLMDKGEIIASGTHRELLENSEIYREICISQLGKKAIGGETNED